MSTERHKFSSKVVEHLNLVIGAKCHAQLMVNTLDIEDIKVVANPYLGID